MIKFKKQSLILSAILIATISLFTSCSKESVSTIGVEAENVENSLKYQDIYYLHKIGSDVTKHENNEIKYTIRVKNSDLSILESRGSNTTSNENEYRIINYSTDEFIEIINIQEYENYYTFDLINNLGNQVNDFTYYGEMFNNEESRCPPCVVGLVTVVVAAAVELMSDSPLEECRNAMYALNCASGTSSYMDFEEGWFSTSCSVGCR